MTPNAHNAYKNQMVTTAGPQRLLIMLLERLQLDIQRALDAQQDGQHQEAGKQLMHAQEIVVELRSSLRADIWEGGPALLSIYDYLFTQLVQANVKRDVEITRECKTLIAPLVDAWKQAALTAAAS